MNSYSRCDKKTAHQEGCAVGLVSAGQKAKAYLAVRVYFRGLPLKMLGLYSQPRPGLHLHRYFLIDWSGSTCTNY